MIASAGAPPRIADYSYEAPTESEVVASLTRVFGPERGSEAWARACGVAGVAVGRVATLLQLERCGLALATAGGASATVARSIEIRVRTYNRLAARAATAPRGGATS